MGAFSDTALDLLTTHYPNAELPSDRVAIVRERKHARRLALPPVPVPEIAPASADDQLERDYLTASIRCPKCGQRHDQPVRVVTQAAALVAMRETITPEFVSVCPSCATLAVVAFVPAVADDDHHSPAVRRRPQHRALAGCRRGDRRVVTPSASMSPPRWRRPWCVTGSNAGSFAS